jgi:putative two-component system response regulator
VNSEKVEKDVFQREIEDELPGNELAYPARPEILPARPYEDSAHDQLSRMLEDFHALRKDREDAYRALVRAHHEMLMRLARASEYKDGDTGTHILRTGHLSALLAKAMGMPKEWCSTIQHAAPMHDVGKIGVPDEILKKRGALAVDEWEIMKKHPAIGAEILGGSEVPVLKMAAEIALSHHEKWDGSGYPSGLSGDAIPLSGRIVAVIDFFDALTMDRCYRRAVQDDVVFEMMRKGSGQHFDPDIVDKAISIGAELVDLRDRINFEAAADDRNWDGDWWLIY